MHVLCCCCGQIECDAISQRAFAVRVHSLAHDLLSSLLLLALSRSQIHNTLSLTLCAHFKASQKVDNAFGVLSHLQLLIDFNNNANYR